MKINIAKYAFKNKEQFLRKYKRLHTENNEGNLIPDFKFAKAEIGHILLEAEEVDEKLKILKEPVFSEKYHVDMVWYDIEDHPHGWKSYCVDLDNEGMHGFAGLSYLKHKF